MAKKIFKNRRSLFFAIVFYTVFGSAVATAQADNGKILSGLNLEDFDQSQKNEAKWQNNPFVQVVDEVSVADMQLTAIVYSDKKSAALINGQILHDGDKIGLTEVVHIARDRVVLRNESGIFNLVLKGKDVQ